MGEGVPVVRGELVAAIGVDNAAGRGATNPNGIRECAQRSLWGLVVVRCPADDFPVVCVENDCCPKESLSGADDGEVGEPQSIRCRRVEAASYAVEDLGPADWRGRAWTRLDRSAPCADAVEAHQPRNPMPADPNLTVHQCPMDPRSAVVAKPAVNESNLLDQSRILGSSAPRRFAQSLAPAVIARRRDAQQSANRADMKLRVLGLPRLDVAVELYCSERRAKKASAFPRISSSSSFLANSRSSRAILA